MSVLLCDNYILKYYEIIDACEIPTTTKTQLETLINELGALETEFNGATVIEDNKKYIHVKIITMTKLELYKAFISFVKVREGHYDTFNQTTNFNDLLAYMSETREIDNYLKNHIISGCFCMGALQYIIQNTR